LACFDIPDAVTRQKDKLDVAVKGLNSDLRERRDSLVLGGDLAVALVLEVTEGARKSESTVDTALFNETAGALDALKLARIFRLVIL